MKNHDVVRYVGPSCGDLRYGDEGEIFRRWTKGPEVHFQRSGVVVLVKWRDVEMGKGKKPRGPIEQPPKKEKLLIGVEEVDNGFILSIDMNTDNAARGIAKDDAEIVAFIRNFLKARAA